jgi:endonuclease III
MSKNTKQTSGRVASLASETLRNGNTSQTAKTLAASALSQRSTSRQTGSTTEDLASKVLASAKYAEETKILAASVLAQSNKDR